MSVGGTSRFSDLGGGPEFRAEEILRLMSLAVFGAIVEDWTVESVELYRASGEAATARRLPDNTIGSGSRLERQLMERLVGGKYPVDWLPTSVRDFLSLTVSGSRVLEGETAFCQVAWVSRGGLAEPVFTLLDET